MSNTELVLCWILISLIIFLLLSNESRKMYEPMEEWDKIQTFTFILMSIIFPFGLFLVIKENWSFFIKERNFKK